MNPQERYYYDTFSDGFGENLLGVDLSYRGFLSRVSGYLGFLYGERGDASHCLAAYEASAANLSDGALCAHGCD